MTAERKMAAAGATGSLIHGTMAAHLERAPAHRQSASVQPSEAFELRLILIPDVQSWQLRR